MSLLLGLIVEKVYEVLLGGEKARIWTLLASPPLCAFHSRDVGVSSTSYLEALRPAGTFVRYVLEV